jgi:leader peptidase (prepilin peptidase)/N-methyltransferase
MLAFASLTLAMALVDWDHQIIPDELSLGGLGFMLALSVAAPEGWRWTNPDIALWASAAPAWTASLLAALAGTLAFRKALERAREEDPDIDAAIGFGDVKLTAFMGAFLGWRGVLAAFFVAAMVGAFAGVYVRLKTGETDPERAGLERLRHRWRTGSAIMPFGPWLVFGGLAVMYFRVPLFDFFGRLLCFEPDPARYMT